MTDLAQEVGRLAGVTETLSKQLDKRDDAVLGLTKAINSLDKSVARQALAYESMDRRVSALEKNDFRMQTPHPEHYSPDPLPRAVPFPTPKDDAGWAGKLFSKDVMPYWALLIVVISFSLAFFFMSGQQVADVVGATQ